MGAELTLASIAGATLRVIVADGVEALDRVQVAESLAARNERRWLQQQARGTRLLLGSWGRRAAQQEKVAELRLRSIVALEAFA